MRRNELPLRRRRHTDTQLVAGESEVRLKAEGVWADELRATKAFPPPAWSYYSALWDGASYWLGGATGLWVQGYKTNATSDTLWYEPAVSVHHWLWAVTRTPHFYLAVGDRGTVMASDNGIDWDLNLVPASVTNTVFLGVGGTTNRFVAVGNAGAIIHSTNGVTWEAVEPRPTTNDLQGFAATGDLFLAAGAKGTILTSITPRTGRSQTTPTTQFLSSLASFPGGLYRVGRRRRHPHQRQWHQLDVAFDRHDQLVLAGALPEQALVLVGENGTLRTSTDGIDWTARTSGTTEWLTDAAFVEDTWFVVGTGGTVLTSTNLTDWSNVGTLTRKSLFGAAASDGQLLTVGVEGIILRSQIVPRPDPHPDRRVRPQRRPPCLPLRRRAGPGVPAGAQPGLVLLAPVPGTRVHRRHRHAAADRRRCAGPDPRVLSRPEFALRRARRGRTDHVAGSRGIDSTVRPNRPRRTGHGLPPTRWKRARCNV